MTDREREREIETEGEGESEQANSIQTLNEIGFGKFGIRIVYDIKVVFISLPCFRVRGFFGTLEKNQKRKYF